MIRIKRYFVTGLIIIVPVFLTAYLFIIVFQFLDGILGGILNNYIKSKLGFYIPGLGLILSLAIVLLVGFIAGRFIGKKIFRNVESWFTNLPLIKNVYPAFKQLIGFVLNQKELGFKKVVLVEYPSKGIWSVGFLTNENYKKIDALFGKAMVSVFMPNSPGPLTGYVIFVAKEELKFADISVSDAIKIIVSGGVIKLDNN